MCNTSISIITIVSLSSLIWSSLQSKNSLSEFLSFHHNCLQVLNHFVPRNEGHWTRNNLNWYAFMNHILNKCRLVGHTKLKERLLLKDGLRNASLRSLLPDYYCHFITSFLNLSWINVNYLCLDIRMFFQISFEIVFLQLFIRFIFLSDGKLCDILDVLNESLGIKV